MTESFLRMCAGRRALLEGESTVATVARDVGLSPFQFIREFRAFFGLTPLQYRTRERIERAKTLLAVERRSVTDVCMELGFSSLGSFSALFTRRVGVSPSVYRTRVHVRPACLQLMRNFEEA